MAKKRSFFKRARTSTRRISRRSNTSGSSSNPMSILLPAFAYGSVRAKAKELAQPITNFIPIQYGDEIAFGLLGWYMAKKQKGFLKNLGTAVLTVEAASMGNQIVAPMIATTSGMNFSNASGSGSPAYI